MKGLINIKNNSSRCFLWCHVRCLNPMDKDPQRVTKRDREIAEGLNYEGVTFPMNYHDYERIERQNRINVNVFSYEGGRVLPFRTSSGDNDRLLDVLIVTKGPYAGYRPATAV